MLFKGNKCEARREAVVRVKRRGATKSVVTFKKHPERANPGLPGFVQHLRFLEMGSSINGNHLK